MQCVDLVLLVSEWVWSEGGVSTFFCVLSIVRMNLEIIITKEKTVEITRIDY